MLPWRLTSPGCPGRSKGGGETPRVEPFCPQPLQHRPGPSSAPTLPGLRPLLHCPGPRSLPHPGPSGTATDFSCAPTSPAPLTLLHHRPSCTATGPPGTRPLLHHHGSSAFRAHLHPSPTMPRLPLHPLEPCSVPTPLRGIRGRTRRPTGRKMAALTCHSSRARHPRSQPGSRTASEFLRRGPQY